MKDPIKRKEAMDHMMSVPYKTKRIAGKSIPDEKFCSIRADMFLRGESSNMLNFLEAAYFFNYLKVSFVIFNDYIQVANIQK